jgi:fermentation-respiration switch protein FrsA (DUF1100 family)
MKNSIFFLLLAAVTVFPGRSQGAMEHTFLYFPMKELVATPAIFDLPYEEVLFPAADGALLHGWFVPGTSGKPLILFCHGNAGNISHRIENLYLFRRETGVSVFIFDYRGYGKSEGTASEEGTYADARGALEWLENRGWKPERMIYFGRSLGAGVAVQMALEKQPAGLVLETPFPSVSAMGRHHYPFLYTLLSWAVQARYDSLEKIPGIRVPLLIFQGDRDFIVPEKMARRVFERANEPKTFHLIPGAGHNDTYDAGGREYWDAWRRFLAQVFPL